MFGRLMVGLDERGLLDRAIVVVLSDHGEELGERGAFNHRFSMQDEVLHVPLMVRLPGGEEGGRRVKGLVELVDVMPTLLEAARAALPAGARGRSLLRALRGADLEPRAGAFSQGALRMVSLRTVHGRLTFTGAAPDAPWLADLVAATGLDGDAFEASGGMEALDASTARDALASACRALAPSHDTEALPDAGIRQELERHGYWTSP
jgi:hypothetical protein